MKLRHPKFGGAFTLVEVMAAILILSVAMLGASGYRYFAALDERRATIQATAARIGLLLCESWRGVKGDETFDPTAYFASDLTINKIVDPSSLESQYKDPGFTLLGACTVTTNGINYDVLLSWKDLSTELRALNVVVTWYSWRSQNPLPDKSFKLTTYTLN